MKHKQSWFAAAALAVTLGLAGCGQAPSSSSADPAPTVTLGDPGKDGVKSVTLSEQAAQRLGVATAAVQQVPATGSKAQTARPQLVIPYASLVYDEQGQTWAYVAAQALTYVRHAVSVDHIAGPAAYLSNGPQAGSQVVTTGSEELLGAEYEISGE